MEIWERGAGYTLASGSSSCAAAAVAHRLGLCDASVTVHMPGGQLGIEIRPDFTVRMTGPVVKVVEGELARSVRGHHLQGADCLQRRSSLAARFRQQIILGVR